MAQLLELDSYGRPGSESLRRALRSAQKARALGRYNEATVILDDYFNQDAAGVCSSIRLTARIEFTLNYLAQGYMRRAHETLLGGLDPGSLMRDVQDPELALFDLLVAAVQFRYGDATTIDACNMRCLLVWKGHLEGLELGGHTETHVKLEILFHETRHYIALQRRESSGHISASIMTRLIMICNQLCAEGRHSEALEVAQLRKRLWPSIYYGVQSSDQLSLEEAVSLCCAGCMLDIVEDVCGGASHFHAHIDMRTIQFHSLLSETSTTAKELDQEALCLVSCYEDVDYPRGALFVLQLLLTWKSKHGIPFLPIYVELVRSLESRTGELLPLVELGSIPPSQHFGGAQHTPLASQTNTVIRGGLINHMAHSVSQAPPMECPADRISAHSRAIAPQQSSSKRSRNPFSRLVSFIRGDFSEERLSASGPLSYLETLFLAGGIQRSLRRGEWQEPETRRKIQVLCERMPLDFPEEKTVLATTCRILDNENDPVQAIEVAEATLRGCTNVPLSKSWGVVYVSHVVLGKAHYRLRNLDKAMHHYGRAKAAAENAPCDTFELVNMMETAQFAVEYVKEFHPGRNMDELPIESTRQKALQLLQTPRSDDEKALIFRFLRAISPDDHYALPEMIMNKGSAWELLAAIPAPTTSTADFDPLKAKLRMFEELREKGQTHAKSLASAASVGYFALGYTLTTRALEFDPPLINLLHEARLCHQAALGALEYGGAANSRRYAEYLWAVGETWKYEGTVSKDPVAYQLAYQEFRAAEDMLHETRNPQEPTADDALEKLIAKQQIAGQYDAVRIGGEVFLCCWHGGSYAPNETQQSSFFQQAWELVQRQKSRGLLDVMSMDAGIPVSILQALQRHPEQNALLQEESRLLATLSCELSGDRNAIRNSLQSLRMKMKQYPLLEIAMRARDGEGFNIEDLYCLSAQISDIGSRVVFVDWFTHLDLIYLFTATCTGLRFQIFCHRLSISESTVSAWVRSNLKTHVLADNDDSYYRLRELKELIAPLKSATMPADIPHCDPVSYSPSRIGD